nr:elongation factor 1-delta 1-like isoform X1 [Ipomoea batatas]
MAVAFYNLNSDAGLKKLDEYLLTRSYISGYQASKDDITVYSSLPKPPSSEYVNASRWYKHIDALLRISGVSGEGCGVIIEVSAPIPAGVVTPPATDTKVAQASVADDVDLFGEETEEKKKGAEERAAAVKASSKTNECNSWRIPSFPMQAAAGQLSAPVPPSEKGGNGSSKDFKKVQTTKRTFVETVTKAPRFGDEVMEEAGDANWFEEEILVESDSEDEEDEEGLAAAEPHQLIGLPPSRKDILKNWKHVDSFPVKSGDNLSTFKLAPVDLNSPLQVDDGSHEAPLRLVRDGRKNKTAPATLKGRINPKGT